jgi:hypothetical protein
VVSGLLGLNASNVYKWSAFAQNSWADYLAARETVKKTRAGQRKK